MEEQCVHISYTIFRNSTLPFIHRRLRLRFYTTIFSSNHFRIRLCGTINNVCKTIRIKVLHIYAVHLDAIQNSRVLRCFDRNDVIYLILLTRTVRFYKEFGCIVNTTRLNKYGLFVIHLCIFNLNFAGIIRQGQFEIALCLVFQAKFYFAIYIVINNHT